ncbi:SGNH/GDSL hydrolase family protein [Lacibacter sp. H375]|uniref:SGNH/GDSL hydrolase family protein n=1 Tax=Lacibacter sp. H375 TaxID=3133424 RepID=UPI0030BDBC26
MKKICSILLSVSWLLHATAKEAEMQTYLPDHAFIQYTGRIDFRNAELPRFWQPGVYISFRFTGNACELLLHDEMLWGSNHNYIELIVDGKAIRLQTKTKSDTLSVTPYLTASKEHSVILCKNTEANIGYMELAGIRCEELLRPLLKPQRKIECIGNSITCGTGSDASEVPCGKGKWQDQHNAWFSYGAIMARKLNAQFHLSSVSGIGLMRSCCNMNITMPQVFDKVNMRNDTITWNFKNYQPDVVTVCLGQNDGIQDAKTFCRNYVLFIRQLRVHYPSATFVLLSSPMASETLKDFMRKSITSVIKELNTKGERKVHSYIFSKQYKNGCDNHPSLEEHEQIAEELTAAVKKIMKWQTSID